MVMYETSLSTHQADLDKPEEAQFNNQIARLGKTPEGTVRIFDRKDYYSAHGQDALYIAANFYKTNSILKYTGQDKATPYCTFSSAVACTFLRDALTAKQLRIEIWVKEGGKLKLDKQASPGNLQDVESMLFGQTDILSAPTIAAISFSSKASEGTTVGVAFADSSSRQIGISQFVDNELFSNVESLIIQLGVKEALLCQEEGKQQSEEAEKLRSLVDRCNVVITERKRSEFKATHIEQDLRRLLDDSESTAAMSKPQFELTQAMSSCAALISYLSLVSDPTNHGNYTLTTHDLAQYMRLDASAVRALHLMPDSLATIGNASNKNMSVFGILNRCKTAQGTRLLAQWLKQPLVVLHEINQRQNLVDIFVQDVLVRQSLQDDHLRAMPDLNRICKKFQRGNANLQDVARAYQAVLRLAVLIETLKPAGNDHPEPQAAVALIKKVYLDPFMDLATQLIDFENLVETTLDLAELENNNYVIKPEYNEQLTEIKAEMDKLQEGLDEEYRQVAADLGFETDNKTLHFEKHQVHSFCFRLTRKEANVIKNKSKYIELAANKSGTFFVTKTLKRLGDDFAAQQVKYERHQSSLVTEVVAIAASYTPAFLPLNSLLAHLDVIVSLATVAVNAPIPYVKPTLTPLGEGNLVLKESRHPCLEVQDDILFVPNDVEMIRGESEFQIITGPNMGGKSTFIRQVGTIALMAQIGSFVPCEEATLPVFDCVLARVGAGDYQIKGVSTFMAEMLETASILKSATKNSLIIIDELGRGTGTADGFGLAWAISEEIATKTRAFCFFATHYHELCSLADEVAHVKNLHVIAQVQSSPTSFSGRDITLLYKVEPGFADQSFGIAVAEMAKFPPEVVKLAKRKADDLEAFEVEAPADSDMDGATAFDPQVVSEGTALLKKMMLEWAEATGNATGQDVEMDGGSNATTVDAQGQVESLKTVFQHYSQQLEANAWTRSLLASA